VGLGRVITQTCVRAYSFDLNLEADVHTHHEELEFQGSAQRSRARSSRGVLRPDRSDRRLDADDAPRKSN
jgi:hypothetical protein